MAIDSQSRKFNWLTVQFTILCLGVKFSLLVICFLVFGIPLLGNPALIDAPTGWSKSKVLHDHSESSFELPIIFFQKVLSPQDGPVCRFSPTCSRFGREAIRKHGFWIGILMTSDRLIRDNPFNPAEYDAVPENVLQ